MRYLSVCSGIEAASVAWHSLGWQAAAFSEIDAFPRAVLAHHYPDVPCHGDFTTIGPDEYGTIDLLVGGTPCQSFSVAGQRKGMADDRGNLALEFIRLARRKRARWLAWENVPGVFSSNGGDDFRCFLSGLVGWDVPVPDGGWKNAGVIASGPGNGSYGVAWRVLDAQFAGVPQRRRRVFVVGYIGDWRRAAAVLFERHSLSGNTPPRRQAGKIAPTIPSRSTGGGGLGTDFDCDGGLIVSTGQVSHCLNAGGMGRQDYETETLIAHILRGEGFDASEDGTGRGTPLVPICFSAKDHGADASDIAPTLRSGSHSGSHANGGVMPAVAYDLRGREHGAQFEGPHDTANIRAASGGSSRSYVAASAVRRLTPRECERLQGFPDDYTLVPHRGKPAADGPRYKALGNSFAVPVMRWIGERIAAVEALP